MRWRRVPDDRCDALWSTGLFALPIPARGDDLAYRTRPPEKEDQCGGPVTSPFGGTDSKRRICESHLRVFNAMQSLSLNRDPDRDRVGLGYWRSRVDERIAAVGPEKATAWALEAIETYQATPKSERSEQVRQDRAEAFILLDWQPATSWQ